MSNEFNTHFRKCLLADDRVYWNVGEEMFLRCTKYGTKYSEENCKEIGDKNE